MPHNTQSPEIVLLIYASLDLLETDNLKRLIMTYNTVHRREERIVKALECAGNILKTHQRFLIRKSIGTVN